MNDGQGRHRQSTALGGAEEGRGPGDRFWSAAGRRSRNSGTSCHPVRLPLLGDRAVAGDVDLAWMRLTLVKPLPGNEPEALRLLKELDESIGPAPGLLFSIVLSRSAPRAGRISLWRSKGEADREVMSDRTLALRSRLHTLSA